ncbi:MAG: FKBP-type peptidylprolyl isomerase [Actinobacteria bacterium]|uniref:peptidylprolyl isomerase n=1 Tax=freshwater metagenome TaxID=449393 RepID=A0A6J6DVG6_9ZZZZ|nr:FKBP-type peptidylprolyl isomerase [Actinomycetota bacterium]
MPKKTLVKIFAIIAVAAIAFASFTSLGGDDNVSGSTSASGLPSVTDNAGEAPTITPPTGAAPTTLQSVDIIEGTGAEVLATSTITFHYTLMSWSDGQILESSWTSGQPAVFPLTQLIAGWQQGLPGMKVGGRRLLVVPPSLGYGVIPGHPLETETLIFSLDILAVS